MSRHVFSRLSALLIALSALGGCSSAPSRISADITFADRPPIGLNVANIEIVQSYQPAFADPYVDHLFPREPAAVIRRWAEDRLAARGATGTATLIIQEASVTEEELSREPGVKGLVMIEQSERYEARFAVRIEIRKPAPEPNGSADVLAQRSITAPENASLADRERIWFSLTEDTIRDLDARFEQEINDGLPQFVIR